MDDRNRAPSGRRDGPENASRLVTGLVLAGGRSRRMFETAGGGDKAFLDLGGKPMLAHVLARLGPQVAKLVISANGEPQRFAAYGYPVVADTIAGSGGPLAGVLAGLTWSALNAPEARFVVSVSADAPFLPEDLVARLLAALDASLRNAVPRLAIASSGGKLHPVIGLWPVSLAGEVEAALRLGERKAQTFVERQGALAVEFPHFEKGGRKIDPFFNANTPAELDEARSILRS